MLNVAATRRISLDTSDLTFFDGILVVIGLIVSIFVIMAFFALCQAWIDGRLK